MQNVVKPPEFLPLDGWQEVEPEPLRHTVSTLDYELQGTYFTRPPESSTEAPETTLLTRLRSTLAWAPKSPDLLKSGYYIAREIGDAALSHADAETGPVGEVLSLLDRARQDSHPKEFSYKAGNTAHHEASFGGGHIAIGEVFSSDTKSVEDRLRERNIELLNPEDSTLFLFLQGMGHEAGHAVAAGVSDQIDRALGLGPDVGPENRIPQLASRVYLAKHPEFGFTGDWETDVRIQDERFSEGYKRLVILKSAEYLGYESDKAEQIADLFGYTPAMHAREGHSQLDHISTVVKDRAEGRITPITSLLPEGAQRDKDNPHDAGYDNPGDLGYNLPLTTEQLVDQLREIKDILLGKDKLLRVGPSSYEGWSQNVHTNQDPSITQYLSDMQNRRSDVLRSRLEARSSLQKVRSFLGNLSLRSLARRK